MKNKKIIKIIGTTLCIMILFALSTGSFDYLRVYRAEKPVFTISVTADDGGSGVYYGFGYSIVSKGNFMPEHPLPGIKYIEYSILGIPVKEFFFE